MSALPQQPAKVCLFGEWGQGAAGGAFPTASWELKHQQPQACLPLQCVVPRVLPPSPRVTSALATSRPPPRSLPSSSVFQGSRESPARGCGAQKPAGSGAGCSPGRAAAQSRQSRCSRGLRRAPSRELPERARPPARPSPRSAIRGAVYAGRPAYGAPAAGRCAARLP